MLHSNGSTTGGEGDGGQLELGPFRLGERPGGGRGILPQPVTKADLDLAIDRTKGNNGFTPNGQPIINYNAVYPPGHQFAGMPILKMTRETASGPEVVHTDQTAIITGPAAGRFPAGTYPPNKVEPDRDQPFREYTVIYHDEIGAVQAFPQFNQQPLKHTLHSVRDAFAFNYGTGGIGAEILANRLGVGPMKDCVECKYEEFFLNVVGRRRPGDGR